MTAPPPGPTGGWLRRRFLDPMLALLRQGLSPSGLAWSMAVGLAFGVFPVLGTSTLLCAVAGFSFRLNQPAMQLVNYLAYPLQMLLLIPFIRVGERLTGQLPLPLSLPALLQGAKADAMGTLASLGSRLLPACLAWALLALPAMVLLALVLRPVFAAVALRTRSEAP
ncbi:MAG: DUF2062 domain-containing protein [Holophagaceae bacterium]